MEPFLAVYCERDDKMGSQSVSTRITGTKQKGPWPFWRWNTWVSVALVGATSSSTFFSFSGALASRRCELRAHNELESALVPLMRLGLLVQPDANGRVQPARLDAHRDAEQLLHAARRRVVQHHLGGHASGVTQAGAPSSFLTLGLLRKGALVSPFFSERASSPISGGPPAVASANSTTMPCVFSDRISWQRTRDSANTPIEKGITIWQNKGR